MRLFTTTLRLFIWVLCYGALRPGLVLAQTSQFASSVVPTPVNTDNPELAADNDRSTAAVLHPGVNGSPASERVQFASIIPAGTTAAGVSLRFDNVVMNLLQAQLLPNISIVTYLDGVATGDRWTSTQLLTLAIVQSGQQSDVKLAPAPTKSFNQLELRADGAVNAYTLNFFAAFGPAPAAASPAPLPVQLVGFTATGSSGSAAVRLAWTTASELNSAAFVVERSLDGGQFTAVGQVRAAGSSASARTYAYVDTNAPAGPLYYRLRQVDVDGTVTFSPVRSLVRPPAEAASLALYPVPARGQATLTGAAAGADVQLLDALGRPVLHAVADAAGAAQLALPAGLAAGVYVVRTGGRTMRLAVGE